MQALIDIEFKVMYQNLIDAVSIYVRSEDSETCSKLES